MASPRRYGCGLVGVVICMGRPLHALIVWSRPMRSPLVYAAERLSDPFNSLIDNFESRKRREIICGVVFFTN